MALYFVFLGKQGSGKSTYMKGIAASGRLARISSGELFRDEIRHNTELGKKIEKLVNSGKLVPDKLVVNLLKKRLEHSDCSRGAIFDGFPRTIGQARALEKILEKKGGKINLALNFAAPEKVLLERLIGRRQCMLCGKIYNLKSNPPRVEGKCDECGAGLYHREDDKPEAIKKRWKAYDKRTKPLVEYYKKKGILHTIDASKEIDKVMKDVGKKLKNLGLN